MSRPTRRPSAAQSTPSRGARGTGRPEFRPAGGSTARYSTETGRPSTGDPGRTDPRSDRRGGRPEFRSDTPPAANPDRRLDRFERHTADGRDPRPPGSAAGGAGDGSGRDFPRRERRPAANRPVRGRGPRRSGSAARPVRVEQPSELELALTASLDTPIETLDFTTLKLPQQLLTGLQRKGINTAFPIQARTLPHALAGRDLLGRAETGSGKTLGFGLPMLARLSAAPNRRVPKAPGGLVLVPTRELAGQVTDALAPLGQPMGVRVQAVYGGASMGRQISALRRGVDLLVATPGRLLDLVNQGECDLGSVEITAIDEADHMADLGFLPDVTRLLDQTPTDGQRLMFSATLDRGVDRLAQAYLHDPIAIAVASAAAPVSGMDHLAFTLRHEDKVEVTAEIAARPARTLVFVRTKHGADRLARQLSRTGVEAAAIHGNLAQNARQRALDAFSAGRSRVLVATDVAARGIHVDDVDLVVHFDPPADHKDYLHRSGRTARAGAKGTVLSLLLPDQVAEAGRLHARAGLTVESMAVAPGHQAVVALARSGEPIVVRPEEPVATRPRSASRPQRNRRPGGSGPRRPRTSTPAA